MVNEWSLKWVKKKVYFNIHNSLWIFFERLNQINKIVFMVVANHQLATGIRPHSRIASNQLNSYRIHNSKLKQWLKRMKSHRPTVVLLIHSYANLAVGCWDSVGLNFNIYQPKDLAKKTNHLFQQRRVFYFKLPKGSLDKWRYIKYGRIRWRLTREHLDCRWRLASR